jgi:tetratricopeptide (TPR) repeat protein
MHTNLRKPARAEVCDRPILRLLLLPALISLTAPVFAADSARSEPANAAPSRQTSTPVSASEIAEMKQRALELEKSGKLEEAHKLLTEITELKPDDRAAFEQLSVLNVHRAEYYLKNNQRPEAVAATRQALLASPNNKEANQMLAELYRTVGADPRDVNIRLRAAAALFNQGRYQEAEVEYLASLPLKITADAYVGLGRVAEKQMKHEAARQDFEQALQLDSNSAAAHRELGLSYLLEGDRVGANSELSRALMLDPGDKEAGQNLVKLWKEQVGKLSDANSHLGLARAYQLSGDLPSAQAEYRTVVSLDPQNPALPAARQSFKMALSRQKAAKFFMEASALESQGQLGDACNMATEAVRLSPGNPACMLLQGELLEKLGHPEEARLVYLNILEFDPRNLVAVQRIKQIEIAAQSGQGFAGPSPGFAGSVAAGRPGNTALPANPDQVNSLSSFIGEMRDYIQGKPLVPPQGSDAAGVRAAGAGSIGSKGTDSVSPFLSTAQRLQEMERQNQMLKDQNKHLNETNAGKQEASPPVNPGGLFVGSDF